MRHSARDLNNEPQSMDTSQLAEDGDGTTQVAVTDTDKEVDGGGVPTDPVSIQVAMPVTAAGATATPSSDAAEEKPPALNPLVDEAKRRRGSTSSAPGSVLSGVVVAASVEEERGRAASSVVGEAASSRSTVLVGIMLVFLSVASM